jgi:5-methylcytosine-specific restriction protein B
VGRYFRRERPPPDGKPNPYSIEQCTEDTGFDLEVLQGWIRAIERKGQAILYGPPGTGKTFMARALAKHLVSETDGFVDLVQFHPAYSYEDFIQGIRPKKVEGGLDYPTLPGRFLDFCCKARERIGGTCVLIIDEINRANLSRVFGELMYLLEYREEQVPLAGGTFTIPANVRMIGTIRVTSTPHPSTRARWISVRKSPSTPPGIPS